MIIPNSLSDGDRIHIIAPATSINPAYIDGAVKAIEAAGFVATVSPHAKGNSGSYSGTPEERLGDLRNAFEDSSVKAILCARGGYGAVHLIDSFTPEFLRNHAKWVIGFSDITALHAMMFNAGICSLHASMCKHLATFGINDKCSQEFFDVLRGKMPEYTIAANAFNHLGNTQGTLVGGNMAVMCALMGTPYNFMEPDRVLFIEDIGEQVYKIERMLNQLRLSGALPGAKGLLVGQFTDYHPDEVNHEDMYQMISRMVKPYNYPIAFSAPIGHVDYNVPIVEGATVELQVNSDGTTLRFLH